MFSMHIRMNAHPAMSTYGSQAQTLLESRCWAIFAYCEVDAIWSSTLEIVRLKAQWNHSTTWCKMF